MTNPQTTTQATPLCDAHQRKVSIENEDSCCEIYVKVDGRPYHGDLIDIDFARSLETKLSASQSREAELAKALNEIACINDPAANYLLQQTGSYSAFDEPVSAQIARAALQSHAVHHESQDNPTETKA